MLETITQYNNSFIILCMKDTDHVMKIMNIWMTIDELEVSKTRRDFIYSSRIKETNQFTHRKIFGIQFKYRHKVDDPNNQRHVPIYLKRTWATELLPDHRFYWYLSVS